MDVIFVLQFLHSPSCSRQQAPLGPPACTSSPLAPGLSVDRRNKELCAPQQQYSANPPEYRTTEIC